MRKLILFLLLAPLLGFGQVIDGTINNESTVIKNETNFGQNTAVRVGTALLDVNSGKASRVENWFSAGTNTYTATITWVTSYRSGLRVPIIFNNANTSAVTININGLGAKNVFRNGGTVLGSGVIQAGQAYTLVYTGTHFELEGDVSAPVDYGDIITSTSGVNITGGVGSIIDTGSGVHIDIDAANGSQDGLLISSDWNLFSSKENTLTFNAPLSRSTNTISIPSANGSISGYLLAADFADFNSRLKQNGSIPLTADWNVGGFKLTNLVDPTSAQDAATKAYVDAAGGSSTFVGLSDGPGTFTGKSLNYNRVNAGETALEYRTPSQVLSDIGAQAALSGTGYSKFSGSSVSYNATIPNADLTNSTISGVSLGSNLSNLSIGAELISGGATTYNGSSAKTLAIQAGSVTNSMLAGSISNSNLANSSINIAGNSTSLGGSVSQDNITGLSSTGLVKRTAANTLGIAVSNTDYQAPITFGTGVLTALGNNLNASGGLLSYNGLGSNWATALAASLGSGWTTAFGSTYSALSNPMTTSGDIIYGGASGTATRLAANSTATNKYLQSVSSGTPTYQQISYTDLSGSPSTLNQGIVYTEVGTLMDELFPGSSLNSSNWSGALPTGASISSKLIIASGNSDWSRYIQAVKFFLFEKETFEIYFKAVTKNSGDAWGITQNPSLLALYNAPIYMKFDQGTGANSGQFSIGTTTAANEYGYSQPITFASGDQMKLTIIKRPGKTITLLDNITSPTTQAYGEFDVDIKATGGQYRLSFLGGQQEFSEFKVTSNCRNFGGTSGVVFIGDSQTGGSSLPNIVFRWSDILMKGQTHLFENIGINSWLTGTFSAAKVTEFLSGISAKYLVVNTGYNDAAQSVSTSTYQTNLQTIATTAQGLGYTVIFVSMVPSFTADTSPYDAFTSAAAAATSSQYISIRSSLTSGTTLDPNYVASDAVHMKEAGHLVMANTIATSANSIFSQLLTDFNNTDIKFKSIRFGKSTVPLLGREADGSVVLVDPSQYKNQNYPILQSTIYSQQAGGIGITGGLLIGDVFQQKIAAGQGLRIGFNNGLNDAAASNINITNAGTGGVGFPQAWNNISGSRNLVVMGTTTKGGTYNHPVSGNDNTFLMSGSLTAGVSGNSNTCINCGTAVMALTSGGLNIGIGSSALKAITTGSSNLHLITKNTEANSFSTSLASTIILGEASTRDAFAAGDICLSNGDFQSSNFWIGSKGMGTGTYTFTLNAGASAGTNIVGNTFNIRASRGTGTAEPGGINFQFSTPVGSGTTIHSSFVSTLALARQSVTIGDAVDVALNTTTGTKFGTATTQKLAFYNATPVVQESGSNDVLASLVTLGLRAASSNPPLNLGTGSLTSGTHALQGDMTVTDAKNFIIGSSTGTKIGTATTQKLSFFNSTPIVQPANTVAIDDALTNLGLRASGGTANFTTGLSSTALTFSNTSINTTSGDAATINASAGRFRKDNSGTTFTLTNSFITANSIISLTYITSGITGGTKATVQATSGSATITFEDSSGVATAPSADCDINFVVIN